MAPIPDRSRSPSIRARYADDLIKGTRVTGDAGVRLPLEPYRWVAASTVEANGSGWSFRVSVSVILSGFAYGFV